VRGRLGAWDRPIDKKLSMSCPCATLGGDPLRSGGRTAGSPVQPHIAGCRTSGQKGRRDLVSHGDHRATPIGQVTAGPDRPVPSTCVNANNARAGEGCVPTWLETPGESPCARNQSCPEGAIPSERSLGRDVASSRTREEKVGLDERHGGG
jgi:hypothetical protein